MNDSFFYAMFVCWLSVVFTCLILLFDSCGITRINSTEAKYYQRGDTTVQIITKTQTTIDADTKVPISSFIK